MDSIIVVGAGAAGLMAAYELSKNGQKVVVLEAGNRLGGRIYTVDDPSFSQPTELGAEFIHGDLPETLGLLKAAGIHYHETKGKMFHIEKGKWKRQKNFYEHWDELMKRMNGLKTDMPLLDFLNAFFGDKKYKDLHESVRGFAAGFDLADLSRASTISLYKEWKKEMGRQYRIDGGYQKLVAYLESQCRSYGCIFHTNWCVKKINWQKNEIKILTLCSRYFESEKVVITVPLSVLQSDENDLNYIEFTPSIPEYTKAAKQIGFGTVIKIILQFDESFWNEKKNNTGFILTNEKIPTWWTQLPTQNAILTGWLGGPKALELKNAGDEVILEIALQCLASAFAKPVDILRNKLQESKIANWSNIPFILGGYSYNTPESCNAKKIFRQPVEQTIFFAGEAFDEDDFTGTVEAALRSGKNAALKILRQ